MSEFLLELYSEEIPARMQQDAERGFASLFRSLLEESNVAFSKMDVFSGPCRIIVHISGLGSELPQSNIEIKGPKIDAPAKAIEGFCRSNNISQEKLVIEEVKGQQVYFYRATTPAMPLADFFANHIPSILKKYVWPKSMFWGDFKINWVRPLKNICCIFDGKIVSFEYGHLKANNQSFGHKFISPEAFAVENYQQLQDKLHAQNVILDREERKEMILKQIDDLCAINKLKLQVDNNLLNEVVGLVEYPHVILGKMNPEFLAVPAEVLATAMKEHQKFFAVLDDKGGMAPYFICVSNNPKGDLELITQGNEKVLSARLADAQFFYDEDLKLSLEFLREKTKSIIFHANLGSMYQKTERLAALCKSMNASEDIISAARFCKADLASQVVDEFAKLQGLMGGYYAAHHGYNAETSNAIAQHYLPASPDDEVPTGGAALLSLSDKLDSLLGLYVAGERASGSKDPYGLRRLALGIVRLVISNKLPYSISALLAFTAKNFDIKIESNILDEIHQFVAERFKYWLKKQGHNLVLLGNELPNSLVQVHQNLIQLEKCFENSTGKLLAESYRRAANISQFNSKKTISEINIELLQDASEKALYDVMKNISSNNNDDFDVQVEQLIQLSNALNKFLDDALIKHEDKSIADNRITLLHNVCSSYYKLCDFSVL